MKEYNLAKFKAEVDSLYAVILNDLGLRLDAEVNHRGAKFWQRVNGYGLYRMCYIFANEYSGAPVLLKQSSYLTFDDIRAEYEFGQEMVGLDRSSLKDHLVHFVQKWIYKITKPKFLFWRTHIPKQTIWSYAIRYKFGFIPFKLKLNLPDIEFNQNKSLRSRLFDDSFGNELKCEKKQQYLRKFFTDYYPLLMIEAFDRAEKQILKDYALLEPITAIINESFTSDHESSFILGVLNYEYDIQHWYNEHNKITHIFKFNTNDIILGLVDRFYTNGWSPKVSGKYVQSQSLYSSFKPQKKPKTQISHNKILYICGATFDEITEFANSSIESSGNFKEKFLLRRHDIFQFHLANKEHYVDIKTHPLFEIGEQKSELEKAENVRYVDPQVALKDIIQNYRLVVVEYVSTTYIECLLNNIPVVCICDRTAYAPSTKSGIVEELFSANIFTDKVEHVVSKIVLNKKQIDDWWFSPQTELVKKKFANSTVSYGPDIFSKLKH